MKRFVLLATTVLFLTSCDKKIDGSSEEAFESSIEEVKATLDEDKKEKFEEALALIAFEGIDLESFMQEDGSDEITSEIASKLDGKTAEEILAEGERIQAEIAREEKEQARQEIGELYQQMDAAKQDKQMLEKFEIKRSLFYKQKSGEYFVSVDPIIELTVLNGTDKAVSRAYFKGTLASPERSVPWIEDNFNYSISGGIEPGEEVTWKLAPNEFSDWGQVDAPEDAVLTVEVTQLDGANGDEIYSINDFGEGEEERLEELLKEYPDLKK